MRVTARALACLWLVAGANGAVASGVDGAVGLLVFRPLSSLLNETYSLGVGISVDLGFVHSRHVRFALETAPRMAWGTPPSGSLAADPEAQLFMLPAYALLEYMHPSGEYCPYGGLGAGVLYVHEQKSFGSGLGAREQSESVTCFSWTLQVGVEKGRASRWFAELQFQNAGTGDVEGQAGSGVSLATLDFRLGWRRSLK